MQTDEDSYEAYKKYLEDSLGLPPVDAPKTPMNPYMRFFLERSSEERSKGPIVWSVLTKKLSDEWKDLSANKKEYYEKIYTVRLRERKALIEEF